MSENNDTSNESNSDLLQASRLTGGNGSSLLRSSVLRPSAFGPSVLGGGGSGGNGAVASNHTDGITSTENHVDDADEAKDEMVNNPFMKDQKDDDIDDADDEGAVGGVASSKKDDCDAAAAKKIDDEEEPDERPDPLTLLRKNGLERANLFAAAKSSMPRVEKSGFVFGQNVHERVVVDNSGAKAENSNSASSSGELLFSSVIQNAAKTSENADGAAAAVTTKDTEIKSLTDVAREYEESRAQKRKYEEVETFTGEEHEVNIVDINCKLFAFVNSNWEERGRGSLRLNDSKKEQECSRVVFRTSGNLRLLLNTKVWSGMVAERPSQKSLRLTAMDNSGKIKIFLAMARPVDINQLHKALVERIDLRKASHPEECRAAIAENNGNETKNGAVTMLDEAAEAATVAEPDVDDATEPSPKKSLLAESNN